MIDTDIAIGRNSASSMRTTSTLLPHCPGRVRQALERLQSQWWEAPRPVPCRMVSVGPQRDRKRGRSGAVPPRHWGKLFDFATFELELPSQAAGPARWLNWRDQGEGILWLDDQPYFGFDVAHRHCELPRNVKRARIEARCVQSAIWHPAATGLDPAGSRWDGACLVRRNETSWHAWHDLVILSELLSEELRGAGLDETALLRPAGLKPAFRGLPVLLRTLLRELDEAIDAFQAGGAAGLQSRLALTYRRLRGGHMRGRATLVGHSHVDLVWLWPERIGEEKSLHAFTNALYLMDRYADFTFANSQPAAYEAVERLSPHVGRAVRRRIREKRWEAVGAAYVESDTQLPCGEALLRSLRLGQEYWVRATGRPSRTLWLPDCFGYACCLPALMRLAGVDYFYTNKAIWNSVTPFPHTSFVWRGSDGSEVLAHITPESVQYYNGLATVREARDNLSHHRQSDLHPEALLPTGFGDGGGGVTAEMCERASRIADLAGVPQTAWGRVDAFFARMERARERLPVHTGEIYLQMHRGIFTTQARMKAAYRAAERALQTWEAASAVTSGKAAPTAWWQRLVFAQFHDNLPGSSIAEVYAETIPELTRLAADALADAQNLLGRARGPASWFNPTGHPVVVREGDERRLLLPWTGASWASLAPAAPAPAVVANRRCLSNGRVHARFNEQGEIEQLSIDGVTVCASEPLATFWTHRDQPVHFDAWDIDRATLAAGTPQRAAAKVRVRRDSAHSATLTFTRAAGRSSRLSVHFTLEAGEPFLRVTAEVDWQDSETLLKVYFPTGYTGEHARFGAPFGSNLRPQRARDAAAEAMWEVPGSRWAAVLDDAQQNGLWLATECNYGFSCTDGRLGLSLVRSPRQTGDGAKHAKTVPPTLRRPIATSGFADLGAHVFRFAVGRFTPDAARREQPAAIADWIFTPPLRYEGRSVGGVPDLAAAPSEQPAWLEPLGPGRAAVRWHETLGRKAAPTPDLPTGCVPGGIRTAEVALMR